MSGRRCFYAVIRIGIDTQIRAGKYFGEGKRSVVLDMHKRQRRKKREELISTLANFDDIATLRLVWAVNALQSEAESSVRKYLNYPAEAATTDLTAKFFIHKWVLEGLLLLLLSTPKDRSRDIQPKAYLEFDTAAILYNLHKAAEDAEAAVLINSSNIRAELQRIGHRQFMWQKAFFNSDRMYRYYYVYGQGRCAKYFEEKYGLSINEFAVSCIVLFSQALKHPWFVIPKIDDSLRLRQEAIELTLRIVCRDLEFMRKDAKRRIDEVADKQHSSIAYLPSVMRQFPMVASGKLIIAPLPQLIIYRATSGLYYDLQGGPQGLLEEANNRFEEYGKHLIETRCPEFTVLREQAFGSKKQQLKTPDLLLKYKNEVKVVFECKATKLTFVAQFAEDAYGEATNAFNQIAKGIAQLWKFFSRARRGVYANEKVAADAYGIVLTMDAWFQLETTQLPELRARAEALVAEEPGVLPEDMRDVIFCSIEDLDDVLSISDELEFMDTLKRSRQPEFRGWALPSIRSPSWNERPERKKFPFDVVEVLPLWGEIMSRRQT